MEDRRHPRLRELDALKATLTYKGWERHAATAEDCHNASHLVTFNRLFGGMRKKQSVQDGKREDHPQLVALDALKPSLSYDGWEKDLEVTMDDYCFAPSLFDGELARMRRRQQVHDGDRTDPLLVQLDALKTTLSYDDWEYDIADVETLYLSATLPFEIQLVHDKLDEIRRKQSAVSADNDSKPALDDTSDDDGFVLLGRRTRAERDEEGWTNAIDVDTEPTAKRARRRAPSTGAEREEDASEVEGLADILRGLDSEVHEAARAWCKATHTASMCMVAELELEDIFVAALRIGGNNERAVRKRLAEMRRDTSPASSAPASDRTSCTVQ